MKHLILLLVFILSTSFVEVTSILPNNSYLVGEELNYLLYYGFAEGGTAKITLTQYTKTIYHSKVEAKTKGFARMFIAIDDVYESYFDESTCKPIKAIRNIKENDYKYYDVVTFDHKNNKITSSKSGVKKVPSNIYDIISSLYYLRRGPFQKIKVNDTIKVMTFFADEVFKYSIIFKGREVIETKFGKLKSLKFQPIVETGRVFKESDDMRFWISDDKNYLPLRVEFDMFVGSIKCDLISYKGIRYPLK